MILLERLVERWELSVMKEVMSQVVADVTENPSAEYGCSYVPIPVENSMSKLPKWECENKEQGWWHDQSQFVHGKVVVNTVEEEM